MIKISLIPFMKKWRNNLFNHANELLIASQHMRDKDFSYWAKASISTAFVWTSRYAIIGCMIAAFTHLSLDEHLLVFSRNLIYKVVLMMSVTPGAAGLAEISFPAFFGMDDMRMSTIRVGRLIVAKTPSERKIRFIGVNVENIW